MLSMMLFSLLACGGKKAETVSVDQVMAPAVDPGKLPKWVLNPPKNRKEICAVGSYKMKGNISMAQQASTARARDELSRELETRTNAVFKDYIQEGETNGQIFSEELITSTSEQVSSMSLSGTVVKERKVDAGTMYSLVCLDTKKFSDAFNDLEQLNEDARNALRDRADSAFDDLEAEIELIE